MTLNDARLALAAACNTVPGVNVRAYPMRTPVSGDGWTVLSRLEPRTFGTLSAELTAVVVLGPSADSAEIKLDRWIGPLLDAVTRVIAVTGAFAEGTTLPVEQTPLHVITITATMEV